MQLFSLLWDDVKRQNKVKIDIYAAVSIFTKKKKIKVSSGYFSKAERWGTRFSFYYKPHF